MRKQKQSVYRKLIDETRALPDWEPEKLEPVKFTKKFRDVLTTPLKLRPVVQRAYSIVTDVVRATGSTVIARDIPVDQLHLEMAKHINRFSTQAIMSGGLPLSVHIYDRFKSVIDFGGGRCITIRVQLDMKPESRSSASFIVEESTTFEEINFDLVPPINKKEQRIISASITPHIK